MATLSSLLACGPGTSDNNRYVVAHAFFDVYHIFTLWRILQVFCTQESTILLSKSTNLGASAHVAGLLKQPQISNQAAIRRMPSQSQAAVT